MADIRPVRSLADIHPVRSRAPYNKKMQHTIDQCKITLQLCVDCYLIVCSISSNSLRKVTLPTQKPFDPFATRKRRPKLFGGTLEDVRARTHPTHRRRSSCRAVAAVLAPPIADLVADGLEEEAHLLAAIGEAGAVARLPALRHLPQLPESRSDICRTWSRITSRAAPASSSPTTLDSPPGRLFSGVAVAITCRRRLRSSRMAWSLRRNFSPRSGRQTDPSHNI